MISAMKKKISPSLDPPFQVVKHEVVYQGVKVDHDLMIQCGWRFAYIPFREDLVIDSFDGSILSIPTYYSYYVSLTVKNISSSPSLFEGIYYKDSRDDKAPFEHCYARCARCIVPPEETALPVWFVLKVKGKNFFNMRFSIAHDGQYQDCQTLKRRGLFRKRYELNNFHPPVING